MSDTCSSDIYYSEEYYDFLTENGGINSDYQEEFDAVCTFPLSYWISAAYLRRRERERVPYEAVAFSQVPKCYGLMDMESLDEMGISQVRRSSLNLTGSGVLIGIVDTGIDYQNAAFRYEDGSTKIFAIWDQTDRRGPLPNGFPYGSEYRKEQIEQALKNDHPLDIVPSTDENGHGTFMAGAAAGRENEEQGFSGAAPDADLVIVKLKEAKQNLRNYYFLPDGVPVYSEVDILMGLSYLVTRAEELKRPMVVFLGLGSSQGGHTGNGFLSEHLNRIAIRRGYVVVVSAGNEGNTDHHYHGSFTNSQETIELKVGRMERGFAMELWGKSPYRFRIRLESPTGQMTEWLDAGIRGSREFAFLLERSQVYIDYQVVDPYSGDQGILFRFDSPSEGIWKIIVSEPQSGEKEYDMWLPIRDFVGTDTYFLKPDPFMTITAPGDTGNPITVSAYRQSDGAFYIESSRGYTRNQLIKPDFAAPGVNVKGVLLRDRFGTKSGTSVSAALVAGMAADFLQWAIIERHEPVISTIGVKNYFIRGTRRDSNRSYPNQEWGYGKADLFQVFIEIR
ncbi:MAG: S8 family peptidase [Lachnospiraceae bacterium]|nr:S8 family peptidase [Lachnospiraceae bacterium]